MLYFLLYLQVLIILSFIFVLQNIFVLLNPLIVALQNILFDMDIIPIYLQMFYVFLSINNLLPFQSS
jgi:hypothetical protein